MPILMGISTTYFDEKENEPPENVYIVSLDNGPLPDAKKHFNKLPAKLLKPLEKSLKSIEKELRVIGRKHSLGREDPDDEATRAGFGMTLALRIFYYKTEVFEKHSLP